MDGDGERPVAGRFFSPSPRSKKGTTRNRWDGGVDKEELGGECSSPTRVHLHRTGDCYFIRACLKSADDIFEGGYS